jgi:hypothetical protein
VQQFLSAVFKDAIAPQFDPKLPEMMKIDRTDPLLRFSLSSVDLYQLFGPCQEE